MNENPPAFTYPFSHTISTMCGFTNGTKALGALPVRKSTERFCTAFNLTVEALNSVIGPDPVPMLRRKIHIGQGFFNSVLPVLGSFGKLHGPEFLRYLDCFFTSGFLTLLSWGVLCIRTTAFTLLWGVTENIFL